MTPIEQQIVEHIINKAINAGYFISIYDGEETAIEKSNNPLAIINAMHSTDQDTVFIYKLDKYMGDKYIGFIDLVYGNDGHDVIHDYSISLDAFMESVEILADSLTPQ